MENGRKSRDSVTYMDVKKKKMTKNRALLENLTSNPYDNFIPITTREKEVNYGDNCLVYYFSSQIIQTDISSRTHIVRTLDNVRLIFY